MYPLDRWLVRVHGLLAAIGSLWLVLWMLHFAPVVRLNAYLVTYQGAWLWAGLVILFILSVRYLAFRLQPRKHHAFVRELEGGHIRIGHQTVKEIAIRAAQQIKGVQRVQIKIEESDQGLIIVTTVHAEPVDLNAMGEAIQRAVSTAVQEMTSLTINAVHVNVFELAPVLVQK